MLNMRIVVVLCALFALTVGVATATAGGGNSENAKKCQKNGWMSLYRSDGSSFASQDACVSYAAKGGMLTTKTKTKSQLDCEGAGGVFTAPGISGGLWTCGPLVFDDGVNWTLFFDCTGDSGHELEWLAYDSLYRCL